MIKQLNNDVVKKLTAINIYLNLYKDTLEEVVDDDGNIYLRESGDGFAKISIRKKTFCWVHWEFCNEFSELFSLEENEVELIINRWIEDTYQLENIRTVFLDDTREYLLKIWAN